MSSVLNNKISDVVINNLKLIAGLSEKTTDAINNNLNLSSVLNNKISDVVRNNNKLNNLNLDKTNETVNNNLNLGVGLNDKTPWVVNNNNKLNNLNLDKISDVVGNNNKLNNLNLDKISDVISSNVGNSKTDITFESDATNFIGGLINNESVLSNEIVTSSISFVPYDTSSAVEFNPTSLVNYVRQINEIFYMSGSQLTSSRLDYQDELQLKIVGKFSSGIYLDNLDYNIPYRASFLVKNWPFYQYNTSSYWYLPVPINASNTDFRSSKADWVKAELETGGTLIDEYGFSIDF